MHCLCPTSKHRVKGAFDNTEPPVVAKSYLQCAHCPARFRFKLWLVRHISSYVHMDKFSCGECGESFSRQCSLNRHAEDHHSSLKTVQCTLCPKCFTRKGDVAHHENTVHRKMSTHKFKDCELTFKFNKNVQYHHNRVHSGLKLFCCVQCDAAFHAPNALHNHRKRRH